MKFSKKKIKFLNLTRGIALPDQGAQLLRMSVADSFTHPRIETTISDMKNTCTYHCPTSPKRCGIPRKNSDMSL